MISYSPKFINNKKIFSPWHLDSTQRVMYTNGNLRGVLRSTAGQTSPQDIHGYHTLHTYTIYIINWTRITICAAHLWRTIERTVHLRNSVIDRLLWNIVQYLNYFIYLHVFLKENRNYTKWDSSELPECWHASHPSRKANNLFCTFFFLLFFLREQYFFPGSKFSAVTLSFEEKIQPRSKFNPATSSTTRSIFPRRKRFQLEKSFPYRNIP